MLPNDSINLTRTNRGAVLTLLVARVGDVRR
jgi:hypothetical protein